MATPPTATPVGSYAPSAPVVNPPQWTPTKPAKAASPRRQRSSETRRFPGSQSRAAAEKLGSTKRAGEASHPFLCRGSGSGGGVCTRSAVIRIPSVNSRSVAIGASRASDGLPHNGGSRAMKKIPAEHVEEPATATSHAEASKVQQVRELNEMKQKVQMLTAGLKLLQRHLEDSASMGSESDTSILASPARLSAGLLDKVSPAHSDWRDLTGSVQAASVAGSSRRSMSPPSPPVPPASNYYHSHIAIPRSEDIDCLAFVDRRFRASEEGDSPRARVPLSPGPRPSVESPRRIPPSPGSPSRDSPRRVPGSPAPSVGSRQSPMASAVVKPAVVVTPVSTTRVLVENSHPTTPLPPERPQQPSVSASTEWQHLPRGCFVSGISPTAPIPIAVPAPCSNSVASPGRPHRSTFPQSRSPSRSSPGVSGHPTLAATFSPSRSNTQGSSAWGSPTVASPRPQLKSPRSDGRAAASPFQARSVEAELSTPLCELILLVGSAYRESRAGLTSVQATGLKVLEWCDESSVVIQANMLWIGTTDGLMDAGEDLVQCTLQQHLGSSATSGRVLWYVSNLISLGAVGEVESKLVAAETGRLIAAEALSGVLWNRLKSSSISASHG